MTFGFVWAERCFLVNDHINVMIPLAVLPRCPSTLHPHPPLLRSLFLSISSHACDRAADPCRCEEMPPHCGLSNCYHILSSAACYFSQQLGDAYKYPLTFIECQRPLGGWLILTPFQWCQNVICYHIRAILKSHFPRQWKYELSLWEGKR